MSDKDTYEREWESVKKIREFMIGDLEQVINAHDEEGGGPNFLLAMVLTSYTEFWGRLIKGIPSGQGEVCFKAFYERLGPEYYKIINNPPLYTLNDKGEPVDRIYGEVRSGQVHSYVIEKSAIIRYGRGKCGIEYDDLGVYTFNILTYFEDFKKAIDHYLEEVAANKDDLQKNLHLAIEGRPVVL